MTIKAYLRILAGVSGCARVRIVVGRLHGASSSLTLFSFGVGGVGSLEGLMLSSRKCNKKRELVRVHLPTNGRCNFDFFFIIYSKKKKSLNENDKKNEWF